MSWNRLRNSPKKEIGEEKKERKKKKIEKLRYMEDRSRCANFYRKMILKGERNNNEKIFGKAMQNFR